MIGPRSSGYRELKSEDGDAARAFQQDEVVLGQPSMFKEGVPRGHPGAGEGGGLLEGEVLRDLDEPVFMTDDHLREHAVDRAASGRCVRKRARSSVHPTSEEDPGHAIPDFEAADAGSYADHLPRTVRERHEAGSRTPAAVLRLEDRKVSPIQGRGSHTDQDFVGARNGAVHFLHHEGHLAVDHVELVLPHGWGLSTGGRAWNRE